MSHRQPISARVLSTALAMLVLQFGWSSAARAQEEVVEDDAVPLQGFVEVFEMPSQQFDQWVFGNFVRFGHDGRPVGNSYRGRLDTMLGMKIEELGKICKLTDSQKSKLQLAGRADIKRFVDQVEAKRRKFEEVRKDQNKFGIFYQELQGLRTHLNGGLHGEDSVFSKTIRRTLESDQAEKFDQILRDRGMYRYEAAVGILGSKLGLALGMTSEQRRRFSKVILDETRPPRSMGQQEFQAVFYQASKIPIEKFKDFLDESQIKVLRRQFASMQAWEQALKSNGYIPDDGPGTKPEQASAKKE